MNLLGSDRDHPGNLAMCFEVCEGVNSAFPIILNGRDQAVQRAKDVNVDLRFELINFGCKAF